MSRGRYAVLPINNNSEEQQEPLAPRVSNTRNTVRNRNGNRNTRTSALTRTRINNMYNTLEHKAKRASVRNSLRKGSITPRERNTIYRHITNDRVARCKKSCKASAAEGKPAEKGIGSCVVTNTTIGLKDCTHPDGKTRYHYIRPTELAVDTLQWAFNTGNARIIEGDGYGKGNYFLSLNNFPSLTVETVENEKGEYRDTRRGDVEGDGTGKGFYYAFEDATTLETFVYDKQLIEYRETGLYKTALQYRDMDASDEPASYKPGFSEQDITYVRNIAAFLEATCEYDSSGKIVINPELAKAKAPGLECDLAGIDTKYVIVESVRLPEKGGAEGDADDSNEYIICGYPDPSKMRTYLKMLETHGEAFEGIHEEHRTGFAKLFAEMHNAATSNVIAEMQINTSNLGNEIYKFAPQPGRNLNYLQIWLKQNEQLDATNPAAWINSTDFQEKIRFMEDPKNGLEEHLAMVMTEIERTRLPKEEREQQLAQLDAIRNEYNKYMNALLMEYLNKVMMRIRYYFLIYRRQANGLLVPAVFNIKQLEGKHTPLLARTLELIHTRIPSIFGVGSANYKLFHTYVRDGDFFYITTEYLHTMSNLSHYSYIYETSRELEEIIYASSRLSDVGRRPFYHELKVQYQIKQHRIKKDKTQDGEREVEVELEINTKIQYTNNRTSRTNKNTKKTNGASVKSNNAISNKTELKPSVGVLGGQIILIYERVYQEYTIVFKDTGGIFHVIVVKSNMAAEKGRIMQIVNQPGQGMETYKCGDAMFRTVDFAGNLFQIITTFNSQDNKILWNREFNKIIFNNPIFITKLKKGKIDSKYETLNDILSTSLLPHKFPELKIINIFYYKPILNFNFVMSWTYLNALLKFKKSAVKRNSTTLSEEVFLKRLSEETMLDTLKYGCYNDPENKVNYRYNFIINPDNCGYILIEAIPNYNKNVFWLYIIPYDNTLDFIYDITFLNKTHLKLLYTIKKYYATQGKYCFLNKLTSYRFKVLHFHIETFEYNSFYKRGANKQIGTDITRDLAIDKIISNIELSSDYYNSINTSNLYVLL